MDVSAPSEKHSLAYAIAKLKAASRTSALMSGFAMAIIVELDMQPVRDYNSMSAVIGDTNDSSSDFSGMNRSAAQGLLIAFVICSSLLVGIHALSLLISTCMLPHLEASKDFSLSPHVAMSFYINLAWVFSNVVGMLLFLITMLLLCWIKLHQAAPISAYASYAAVTPLFVLLVVFGVHYYTRLASFKYADKNIDVEGLTISTRSSQTDQLYLPGTVQFSNYLYPTP